MSTTTIMPSGSLGPFEVVECAISVTCPSGHAFTVTAPETEAKCPECDWWLSLHARVSCSVLWYATEGTANSYGDHTPKGSALITAAMRPSDAPGREVSGR